MAETVIKAYVQDLAELERKKSEFAESLTDIRRDWKSAEEDLRKWLVTKGVDCVQVGNRYAFLKTLHVCKTITAPVIARVVEDNLTDDDLLSPDLVQILLDRLKQDVKQPRQEATMGKTGKASRAPIDARGLAFAQQFDKLDTLKAKANAAQKEALGEIRARMKAMRPDVHRALDGVQIAVTLRGGGGQVNRRTLKATTKTVTPKLNFRVLRSVLDDAVADLPSAPPAQRRADLVQAIREAISALPKKVEERVVLS